MVQRPAAETPRPGGIAPRPEIRCIPQVAPTMAAAPGEHTDFAEPILQTTRPQDPPEHRAKYVLRLPEPALRFPSGRVPARWRRRNRITSDCDRPHRRAGGAALSTEVLRGGREILNQLCSIHPSLAALA